MLRTRAGFVVAYPRFHHIGRPDTWRSAHELLCGGLLVLAGVRFEKGKYVQPRDLHASGEKRALFVRQLQRGSSIADQLCACPDEQ
jgi:hypothetical protein